MPTGFETCTGSSPLVRGTPIPHLRLLAAAGIIPACAGNTPKHGEPSVRRRDHPRVCGEHGHVLSVADRYSGSSPRVRGTPVERHAPQLQVGIIPACAGNTLACTSAGRTTWDHPRVCGEHASPARASNFSAGSSPRVRGTPMSSRREEQENGIIPACAGSTYGSSSGQRQAGDHPRVCGEHGRVFCPAVRLAGSSPRVRGTPELAGVVGDAQGIIPACAGNTSCSRAARAARRDHPRVCGEHPSEQQPTVVSTGSSPRVRGTPLLLPSSAHDVRIIPACAGNTLGQQRDARHRRDHPRVCGEHFAGIS